MLFAAIHLQDQFKRFQGIEQNIFLLKIDERSISFKSGNLQSLVVKGKFCFRLLVR
jgi:hypothetical protein